MSTEMKDGLGNEFTLRTKDVSVDQKNGIRQNWHLATKYPIDHTNGGAFYTTAKSNTIAAALTANSPIASFRFSSASLICAIRRLEISAWTLAAGFAAGIASFDAFVARQYTSEDTGGLLSALSANTPKLRTNMQTTQSHLRVSDTGTLTAGTRTLDAHPFETAVAAPAPTATNTLFFNDQKIFNDYDHPLILVSGEGVIIQASVPATGTWAFALTAVWDEVELANFN